MDLDKKRVEEANLLAAIHRELPRLKELLRTVNGKWNYEDRLYRFYHESFKVFGLQGLTVNMVLTLQGLMPHLTLNLWFQEIVSEGTGKDFVVEMNQSWLEVTRPIVEAFFHARYFLEMACKYGSELTEPPQPMPSGWAALMELYELR